MSADMKAENPGMQDLIADLSAAADAEEGATMPGAAPARPRRALSQMMRRIPVTLTLEVGSANVSLQDLVDIGPESVVELDRLAGEPLVIKVNGTAIGRAEVVVAGENYGLKVIDLDGLDLEQLAS
jgi:flagellar motor switch protein FliN/FliY